MIMKLLFYPSFVNGLVVLYGLLFGGRWIKIYFIPLILTLTLLILCIVGIISSFTTIIFTDSGIRIYEKFTKRYDETYLWEELQYGVVFSCPGSRRIILSTREVSDDEVKKTMKVRILNPFLEDRCGIYFSIVGTEKRLEEIFRDKYGVGFSVANNGAIVRATYTGNGQNTEYISMKSI